jgi:hypothetical protein
VAGLLLLGLASLSLASCGDETVPQGATVSAPGDIEVTYQNSAGGPAFTAAPLQFQVLDASGNPLPGVTIRFFAGGEVDRLADRTGAVLSTSDPLLFETTTNDQGLSPTDIYARWQVPACSATEDLSGTGTVTASVGVASATWTVSFTASQC